MGEGFQTFQMTENDEKIGQKSKRWSGETGRTARFSLVWWPGLENKEPKMEGNPVFAAAQTHYIQNVGYVINQGPEYTKLAGEAPRQRVATIIVVWPTDKAGTVDKSRLAAGEAEVMAWVFSGDKYKSLRRIHGEFPFHSHDITVECQDSKFQKLVFSPCRESLLKMFMDNPKAKEMVDKIVEEAATLAESIGSHLGQSLSISQLQEKLAGGPGAPAAVSGAVDTVTSDQVDEIVGDLLDD